MFSFLQDLHFLLLPPLPSMQVSKTEFNRKPDLILSLLVSRLQPGLTDLN